MGTLKNNPMNYKIYKKNLSFEFLKRAHFKELLIKLDFNFFYLTETFSFNKHLGPVLTLLSFPYQVKERVIKSAALF